MNYQRLETLVDFRKENNLLQSQMSQRLGVSKTFYEKIEYGQRNPSYNFIKKFVRVFPASNIKQIFFSH